MLRFIWQSIWGANILTIRVLSRHTLIILRMKWYLRFSLIWHHQQFIFVLLILIVWSQGCRSLKCCSKSVFFQIDFLILWHILGSICKAIWCFLVWFLLFFGSTFSCILCCICKRIGSIFTSFCSIFCRICKWTRSYFLSICKSTWRRVNTTRKTTCWSLQRWVNRLLLWKS